MNANGTGSRLLTKGDQPAWSPDGNKIVFISSGNIAIINKNGTNLKFLTNLTNTTSHWPKWSPDGKMIAYSSMRNLDPKVTDGSVKSANVWVMNADGTNAHPLTKLDEAGIGDPFIGMQWLPDSKGLIFNSQLELRDPTIDFPHMQNNLWEASVDGTTIKPITTLLNAPSVNPAF